MHTTLSRLKEGIVTPTDRQIGEYMTDGEKHNIIEVANKLWPMVLGTVLVIIAFAETRISVFHNADALEKVSDSNSRQWQVMSETKEKLTEKINTLEHKVSKLEAKASVDNTVLKKS